MLKPTDLPYCQVADESEYVVQICEPGNEKLLRHVVSCPTCLDGLSDLVMDNCPDFPSLFVSDDCVVALAPSRAAITITKTDEGFEASCVALNRLAQGSNRCEAFTNLLEDIKEYVEDLEQHRDGDGEFGGEAAEHVQSMVAEQGDLVVWYGKFARAMREHLPSL